MTSNDRDLRARFNALRRVDAGAAPDLEALIENTSPPRRHRVILPAAAAAAAILMLVAGLRSMASRPSAEYTLPRGEASLLAWRSPTASLLQTPGMELLQTVPTLESSLLQGIPWESRSTPPSGR